MPRPLRSLTVIAIAFSLLLAACLDEAALRELESALATEEAAILQTEAAGVAEEPATSTPRPPAPTRTPAPATARPAADETVATVPMRQTPRMRMAERSALEDPGEARSPARSSHSDARCVRVRCCTLRGRRVSLLTLTSRSSCASSEHVVTRSNKPCWEANVPAPHSTQRPLGLPARERFATRNQGRASIANDPLALPVRGHWAN